MIWLFDVNVLIAIADASHTFHEAIHRWLEACPEKSWASCPITENGMVRVLSQPAYRGPARTPAEAVATLREMKHSHRREAKGHWKHFFWADDFSITDDLPVIPERIGGTRQLTDIYLAALAMRRGGRLVTFDATVAWQAIEGGRRELIEVPPL